MPRYHFDLVDSRTVADQGGEELPDDATAEHVAKELALRLREEQPGLKGRNCESNGRTHTGAKLPPARLAPK